MPLSLENPLISIFFLRSYIGGGKYCLAECKLVPCYYLLRLLRYPEGGEAEHFCLGVRDLAGMFNFNLLSIFPGDDFLILNPVG